MKLTKKLLNENKIFNPHDIARVTGEKLYINFRPNSYGRMSETSHWQVIGMDFKTDLDSIAWYNYGQKTFVIFDRADKEAKLAEAKAWVKQRYSLDITERDVWGNWHVTGTMDKLKEIIKEN